MDSLETGARRICMRLAEKGHRALFAGGCVRDRLLGTAPKDYDIATSARPDEVLSLFEHAVPVGVAFGVVLVIEPEGPYEVATFRKDGPYLDGRHPSTVDFSDEEQDAQRRDFTVNALFYDPGAERVVDHVGGRGDIGAKILRTVGEPHARFQEDFLRLLRAVRFAARLDYAIHPETEQAVRELAPNIMRTSAERIRDEIIKILTEGHARRGFELLDSTGLLEHILPEVARLKGVEQPPEFHPEGDVFEHTLLMLAAMRGPSPTLAMGVLLHDIGKPGTRTVEDRVRFNRHDKVGAEIARAICRRLRMSTHDTDRIVWIVDQHMRLANAPKMRESKLKRFLRHEGFAELLEVCRLDCEASHANFDVIEWVQAYLSRLAPEEMRPQLLVGGRDLLAMGYRPGPLFKEILTELEDAQLEGTVKTAAQAREFVLNKWPLQQG